MRNSMARVALPALLLGLLWYVTVGMAGCAVGFNTPHGIGRGYGAFALWTYLSTAAVVLVAGCVLILIRRRWIAIVGLISAVVFGAVGLFGAYARRLVEEDQAAMWQEVRPRIEAKLPGVVQPLWEPSEPYWVATRPDRAAVGFRVPGSRSDLISHLRNTLPRDWIEIHGRDRDEFWSPRSVRTQSHISLFGGRMFNVYIEIASDPTYVELLPPDVKRLDGSVVSAGDRARYGVGSPWD